MIDVCIYSCRFLTSHQHDATILSTAHPARYSTQLALGGYSVQDLDPITRPPTPSLHQRVTYNSVSLHFLAASGLSLDRYPRRLI